MDTALSLKNGRRVAAERASYSSQRDLLLVCPECGEPVHLCERTVPKRTRYFSHPDFQVQSKSANCSLRILGQSFRPASLCLQGLNHGQFTDRFQREVISYLLATFGRDADYLSELAKHFITSSNRASLERTARSLLKKRGPTFPSWLLGLAPADKAHVDLLEESLTDACMFLLSAYGGWVSVWLLALAEISAAAVNPSQIVRGRLTAGLSFGNRSFCFCLERYRVKQLYQNPSLISGMLGSKRLAFVESMLIALIAFTVLKWQLPTKLSISNLFVVTDSEIELLDDCHDTSPARSTPLSSSKEVDVSRPVEPLQTDSPWSTVLTQPSVAAIPPSHVVKVTYLQPREYVRPRVVEKWEEKPSIPAKPTTQAVSKPISVTAAPPAFCAPPTPDDAPDTSDLVIFGLGVSDQTLLEKIRSRVATMRGVGMSSPWVYFSSLGVIVNLNTMVAYRSVQRDNEQTRVQFETDRGVTTLINKEVRWY